MAKIIRLEASSYKKLKAVSLTFAPGITHITGPNDSGKSSALDAFYTAIGGKRASPADPVRHGAEAASISLNYEDKFIVDWACKAGGEPRLVLKAIDGAKYLQPQKMLDEMYEEIALEPSKFERMKPEQQREILAEIVGVKATVDAYDKSIREAYEMRTGLNRDHKKALALLGERSTEPVEPVDVNELLGQLDQAKAYSDGLAKLDQQLGEYDKQITERRETARVWRERAAKLIADADSAEAQAHDLEATRNQYAAGRGEAFDDTPIREALRNAQSINAAHAEYLQTLKLQSSAELLKKDSDELTAQIEKSEAAKAKLIAEAPMPIAGLSLSDKGILFNGVPLEQASQAQRMRVIIAIGVALNPKIKIILLRDASLLDSKTLAEMEADPALAEYYIICETVDESKSRGIVMEDGGVIAIDGELVPTPTEAHDGE